MGIASGADMRHFLNATRKLGLVRACRQARRAPSTEAALHGRGLWLVGGNALVARLYKSARDLGVEVLTEAPAEAPIVEDGRVVGRAHSRTGAVARAARRRARRRRLSA